MGRDSTGFGRILGEIIRTSLPELPIHLRDRISFTDTRKRGKDVFIKIPKNMFISPYIPFKGTI